MCNLQCFLFKMRLRIFVYISAEHKRNAVFNAFFGHVTELPHLIFIKIVDKDIRIAVGKHLCYICTVTVRQKLSVNLSAAYDKSIVTAVFSDNRFYIVNNLRAVTLKIFIGCKYNVFSIFKRFCVRKLSNVFLPITTVLPIVFSLKNSISSDMRNSKFIPLPMPHFSSTAAIIFILFHQEISIPVHTEVFSPNR